MSSVAEGSSRETVRHAVIFGTIEVAVIVALAMTFHREITTSLFDGDSWLFAAFLCALPSIGIQYLSWGVLAGNACFGAYGWVIACEGGLRLLGGIALVAAGASSLAPYGLIIALAPALSVVAVVHRLRRCRLSGERIRLPEMSKSMSWLLGATLLQSVMINAGPLAVKILARPTDSAMAGRFLAAMVLVRTPLFLYNAASASLLPALAGAAGVGDRRAFRRVLDRLVLLVVALGAMCVVGAAVIGPLALRVVFGSGFELPAPDLVLLATAAALLLLTTTLSVALVSESSMRFLFWSWAAGIAAFAGTTAIVRPLLMRVEWGLIVGAGLTVFMQGASLYGRREGKLQVPVQQATLEGDRR